MSQENTGKKKRILKWFWTISGIIVGLIVLSLIIVSLWFQGIVKTAAAQGGPIVLGAPVSVESASLKLIRGRVEIKGIVVGNPKGYKSPNALTVKKIVVDLDSLSLLSNKIRVEEFTLDGVDVYYEQGLTSNNLNDLNKNVQEFQKKLGLDPNASRPTKDGAPLPKLQVDKLQLTGIYVNAVVSLPGTKATNAPLPVVPINLENLGQGKEGITAADLCSVILNKLTLNAFSSLGSAFGDGFKASTKALDNAAGAVKDSFKSLIKAVPGRK